MLLLLGFHETECCFLSLFLCALTHSNEMTWLLFGLIIFTVSRKIGKRLLLHLKRTPKKVADTFRLCELPERFRAAEIVGRDGKKLRIGQKILLLPF